MTLTREGPHQLSGGRPARVLCWDRKLTIGGDSFPIMALVLHPDGEEYVYSFKADGSNSGLSINLIDAPKRRSVWANVYAFGADPLGMATDTRELSHEYKRSSEKRLAILELIYEGDKPMQAILHDITPPQKDDK